MNSPAMDMKDILVAAGVGTFAGTSGWTISIGVEPDADESPDTAITLYDTGGFEPNARCLLDFPTFQVRVRANEFDYPGGYEKALQIRDALLGLPSQDINGTRYMGVWQMSEIAHIGETNNRPIFVTNWRVAREPATGDYRYQLGTPETYTRVTSDGSTRVTSDGDIRVFTG